MFCVQAIQAAPPDILVITSSDADLYTRFTDAFEAEYAAISGTPEARIDTVLLDEKGQLPAPVSPDITMIVSVGAKTAHAVAALELKIPVLYTLIPESTYRSLLPTTVSCARHSAIFIDQPVVRQTRLAETVFPQAKSYGALLGPTSTRHRDTLEALAARSDWQLVIQEVTAASEPEWQTNELVDESDLIIAISDPHALNRNNAKWLLYSAYQRHNPVIGFSRAYVKAGAAAAVYSMPEQIGKQTAEFLERLKQGEHSCLPAPEFPEYFKVTVNADVVHSLGGMRMDEARILELLVEHEQVPQ